MPHRKGIVLYITLAIILMLSTIIMLFLHKDETLRKSLNKEINALQIQLLLKNFMTYFRREKISQDDVFYGAGIPIPFSLSRKEGSITIDSACRGIDANRYFSSLLKLKSDEDDLAFERLLAWLRERHFRDPQLLIDMILDTVDKDTFSRSPGSEIVLYRPGFQNGAILDDETLRRILQIYHFRSSDPTGDDERFLDLFRVSYKGCFDLNFAQADQLYLLFNELDYLDAVEFSKHTERYKSTKDFPIDENVRNKLLQKHHNIIPQLKSPVITINVQLKDDNSSESAQKFGFFLDIKKRKVVKIFRPSL